MATNWYNHYQTAQPLAEVWKCHGDWLSRRADGAGMEGTVTTPMDSRSAISLPATSGSHISLSRRMERSSMKCDESDYSAHHGLWSHLYTRVSYSLHLSLSSFSSCPVILAYHLSTNLLRVANIPGFVLCETTKCWLSFAALNASLGWVVYTLDCFQIILYTCIFPNLFCWYAMLILSTTLWLWVWYWLDVFLFTTKMVKDDLLGHLRSTKKCFTW